MWWWWLPPILMIALIFMALFITSSGMDRFANPRLGVEADKQMTAPVQESAATQTPPPRQTVGSGAPILQVKDLKVDYATPVGDVPAVDDVSFSLRPGRAARASSASPARARPRWRPR